MGELATPQRVLGRYALFDAIASGGMATVHIGRLIGPVGFSRTVAIKRLHPQFARDPEFVSMFVDEARLAARIRHPNVVATLDVIAEEGELFVVLEYVLGAPLSAICFTAEAKGRLIPPSIAGAMMSGCLQGLHAAHEATNERGQPLGIVHRDVSPQNVLVGADGVPRVLDFGIAKAAGRVYTTRDGSIKGKIAYMAPEQLDSGVVTRRSDLYAATVVFWELLTGQRAFVGDTETIVWARAKEGKLPAPSSIDPVLEPYDRLIRRGMARDPEQRFATAREMALELERCGPIATQAVVADWLASVLGPVLQQRAEIISSVESASEITAERVRGAIQAELPQSWEGVHTPTAQTSVEVPRPQSVPPIGTAVPVLVPSRRSFPPPKRSALWPALGVTLAVALALVAGGGALWWRMAVHTGGPPAEPAAAEPAAPAPEAPRGEAIMSEEEAVLPAPASAVTASADAAAPTVRRAPAASSSAAPEAPSASAAPTGSAPPARTSPFDDLGGRL